MAEPGDDHLPEVRQTGVTVRNFPGGQAVVSDDSVRQSPLAHGFFVAVETGDAVIGQLAQADVGDGGMALFRQMGDGHCGRPFLVDADDIRIMMRQRMVGVFQKNKGGTALDEALHVRDVFVERQGRDDAVHAAIDQFLNDGQFVSGVALGVAEDHVETVALGFRIDRDRQFAEIGVGDARYQQGDDRGAPGFQLPGSDVAYIAQGFHRVGNTLPGVGAHFPIAPVEEVGNTGRGNPCRSGDIQNSWFFREAVCFHAR